MVRRAQRDLFGISDAQKEKAETQIRETQKITDYDIREFPVEVIVSKFLVGLEEDAAELYVPDYQRELVWSEDQQSRFIESVLLNLPIPYIFVADSPDGVHEGRLEIVDGVQRIKTLVRFMQNELTLRGLEVLNELDGFTFEDLLPPRKLRFSRKTLRMIELTDQADEEVRRLLFDRLNSGGTKLESMEKRMGSHDGPFLSFVRTLAKDRLFRALCPVSDAREKRREYEELILRFFAYSDRYRSFNKRVDEFLTEYLEEMNRALDVSINEVNAVEQKKTDLAARFRSVMNFVETYLPFGFRKNAQNSSVPRIRFEALAVGVALALQEDPGIIPADVQSWIASKEFMNHTRSDASNSRPKVINRIHFVRDNILGRPVEYDENE